MTSPEDQLEIAEAAFDLIAPVVALAAYLTLVVENVSTVDEILDVIDFQHPAWKEDLKSRLRGDFVAAIKQTRDVLDSIEEKIA